MKLDKKLFQGNEILEDTYDIMMEDRQNKDSFFDYEMKGTAQVLKDAGLTKNELDWLEFGLNLTNQLAVVHDMETKAKNPFPFPPGFNLPPGYKPGIMITGSLSSFMGDLRQSDKPLEEVLGPLAEIFKKFLGNNKQPLSEEEEKNLRDMLKGINLDGLDDLGNDKGKE